MRKGYKIAFFILIIVGIIILGSLVYNKIRKNQILRDAKYVLQINMNYEGYGIAGQKLKGKEPKTKDVEIKKGNTLFIDGYRVSKSKEDKIIQDYTGEIIKIKEINENEVELVINDKIVNLKGNDKYSFMNKFGTSDGLNYSYVVTFISK